MDDVVAFLNRMLDADEQVARNAAFAVADHTYAPVDAEAMASKTATWTTANFMMHKGVTVADPGWDPKVTDIIWAEVATHIARHDPARVLADVAAKRAILNRAVRMVDSFNAATDAPWPDASRRERSHAVETIHDLAAPYDGHPDFDPAWRVT